MPFLCSTCLGIEIHCDFFKFAVQKLVMAISYLCIFVSECLSGGFTSSFGAYIVRTSMEFCTFTNRLQSLIEGRNLGQVDISLFYLK